MKYDKQQQVHQNILLLLQKKNIKTLPLIMASQLNEPDMFISSPVSKQAWPSLPFALL